MLRTFADPDYWRRLYWVSLVLILAMIPMSFFINEDFVKGVAVGSSANCFLGIIMPWMLEKKERNA